MKINEVEFKDIIRLYFVRPMRGKVIKRNEKFLENLEKIPDIDNFKELTQLFQEMMRNNSWYITIQLPVWFMKKYDITNKDLTRLSEPENAFVIERRRLNHELDLKIKEIENGKDIIINVTKEAIEVTRRKNAVKN